MEVGKRLKDKVVWLLLEWQSLTRLYFHVSPPVFFPVWCQGWRDGGSAVRALAALEEDLSSIQQFTTIVTPVPRHPMPSSGLCGQQAHMDIHGAQARTQAKHTYTHKTKFNFFFKEWEKKILTISVWPLESTWKERLNAPVLSPDLQSHVHT